MSQSSTRWLAASASLALMGLLAAPCAQAAAPALKVVKDPVTGQLRAPTAEEAAALDAKSSGTSTDVRRGLITGTVNPQKVYHADGTVELELDENSMSYTVVRRNPDGSLSMACVTGREAAEQAKKTKGGKTATVSRAVKGQRYEEK